MKIEDIQALYERTTAQRIKDSFKAAYALASYLVESIPDDDVADLFLQNRIYKFSVFFDKISSVNFTAYGDNETLKGFQAPTTESINELNDATIKIIYAAFKSVTFKLYNQHVGFMLKADNEEASEHLFTTLYQNIFGSNFISSDNRCYVEIDSKFFVE